MIIEARGVLARINTVKLGFNQTASVYTETRHCEVCSDLKHVIMFDLSGGEYGYLAVCGSCLKKLAENV